MKSDSKQSGVAAQVDERALQALAQRYIACTYARLRRDFDSPLPPLSPAATDALRSELNQRLQGMTLLGRDGLSFADFSLADHAVTGADGDAVELRCVESSRLTYVTADPASREGSVTRQHHFRFDRGPDGDLRISAHDSRDLSAQELDAIAARKDAASASLRRREADDIAAAADASAAPVAGRSARDRRQLVIAGVLFTLIGLGLAYTQGPRSTTSSYCLQTGQRRIVETRLGLPAGSRVVNSDLTEWALARMHVPEAEQRWIPLDRATRGWFGMGEGSTTSASSRIPLINENNLNAIRRLDSSDRAAADSAIAAYRHLLAGLDPADPDLLPRTDIPAARPEDMPTTPFSNFHRTLGR